MYLGGMYAKGITSKFYAAGQVSNTSLLSITSRNVVLNI